MAKWSQVLPVHKDVCLYIPAGYHIQVTSYEELERKKAPGLSFIVQMPLMGEFNNQVGLSSATKHAIKTSNHMVMEAKAPSSQMWSHRLELFRTAFDP